MFQMNQMGWKVSEALSGTVLQVFIFPLTSVTNQIILSNPRSVSRSATKKAQSVVELSDSDDAMSVKSTTR